MYGEFFNIDESAFSIAPNPKYLYLSEQHQEVLAHLLYGVTRSGGFVLITGEIGTGKTTVCRSLFAEIPDNADIALIVNPKLEPVDLLASICDELNITYPDVPNSAKTYLNKLNKRLIESHGQGRNTILIIDEAQNLSIDALETIRGLTNLETDEQKLLQIILIGQPELRERLDTHAMEQLNQRITARFHLEALDKEEVASYIKHRLTIANADPKIFSQSNIDYIYKLTGGIPRLINVLCDRSLLGAFVQKKKKITNETIYNAATESLGKRKKRNQSAKKRNIKVLTWLGVALLLAITLSIILYDRSQTDNVNDGQQLSEEIKQSEESIDEQQGLLVGVTPDTEPQPEPNPVIEKSSVIPQDEILIEPEQFDTNELNQTEASLDEAPDVDHDLEPLATEAPDDSAQEVNIKADKQTLTPQQWAYTSLMEMWGLTYQNFDSDPCDYVMESGLFCYISTGDKKLLERLNRPVILLNESQQGENHYLLLKEVQRDQVLVADQSGEYQLSWEDIQRSWNGEFILIWKSFADTEYIRPGDRGDYVDQIDSLLAKIFNRSPNWEELERYEGNLIKEVRNFQRTQKITADGVLGPLTQIFMNNIVNTDVPTLR